MLCPNTKFLTPSGSPANRPAQTTQKSAHHPQRRIIHQRLGQRAQIMRGPKQLQLVIHQPVNGHVPHIPHQLRSLITGILARNAGQCRTAGESCSPPGKTWSCQRWCWVLLRLLSLFYPLEIGCACPGLFAGTPAPTGFRCLQVRRSTCGSGRAREEARTDNTSTKPYAAAAAHRHPAYSVAWRVVSSRKWALWGGSEIVFSMM